MNPSASLRLLAAASLTLALVAPATSASAAPFPGACSAPPVNPVSLQDIDNDSHREGDIAIGVPRVGSGYVDLSLNPLCAPRRQRVGQGFFTGLPAPVRGDRFGASVTYLGGATLGNDEHADLAIGAPGSNGGRGAVVLARGATSGLSETGAIRLTGRTAGEHFGAAVVEWGQHLFVAAPDRKVAGHRDAGAVDQYLIHPDGTTTFLGSISQATHGVPGVVETGDRFGSRLAAWGSGLLIGDPDESTGRARRSGTVTIVRLAGDTGAIVGARLLARPGRAHGGDRFGAAIASQAGTDIEIGIPGADVAGHNNAGAVEILHGRVGSLKSFTVVRTITQDSAGVSGHAETGDRFGAAVAATTWASCKSGPGVAVGAPGEDVGSVRDAGSVTIVSTSASTGLAVGCRHAWIKGGALGGHPHSGEHLGASLWALEPRWSGSSMDDPQPTAPGFVIGVPGQDIGSVRDAGAVIALFPFGGAANFALRDSAGPRSGEQYGAVASV
jgi:hypothetical protein